MRKYTARIRCAPIINEQNKNHHHRRRANQSTAALFIYYGNPQCVCVRVCLCVFVQHKWICKGIKCHKIKGDNAICSSYRLVSWKHTCIHSSSNWNTPNDEHILRVRFACLFVQSFRRSFVRSVLSIVHSFVHQKNKQIFQSYTVQYAIHIQQHVVHGGFWCAKMFDV